MLFCAEYERDYRERMRLQRSRRHGELSAAVIVHDVEHWWRSRGEVSIREEMERRVAVWLAQRCKEKNMKRVLMAGLLCMLSVPVFAQTPTVAYDLAAPTTVAQVSDKE